MSGDPHPGYLSPAGPRVFAHRGLANDAPENTLLAFELAVAAGAAYIETDVHASADGIAVISHDPDLKRMVGRDAKVGQLTLAELRKIDLGGGQRFCTLVEALEAFPTVRFNIDIKSADAVSATVSAIVQARAADRVLVSSFSEGRRSAALRRLPGVVSSASAPRFLLALVASKLGVAVIVRWALRGLAAVQVPERALGMTITTPRVIAAMHAAGVEMHVWTINDPTRMAQLLDLGVDGIVTDRVDLGLAAAAKRAA